MSRFQSQRRVQIEDGEASETIEIDENGGGREGSIQLRPSGSNVTEDQEPFIGVKVHRKAYRHRDYWGDYMTFPSRPYVMKILDKQGNPAGFDAFSVNFVLFWLWILATYGHS
ncbi:hypothetical protein Acr_02g0012520 [Actinidia rufa]|uniref:Uncharacterized protein n=1 Tax=Actinidia rufa TaxID=165716 RepID=A0A7J0E9M4_9ERIC|nr:hypothetical protein Acr_02g0012520 [Actinidia rufa]